MHNAKAMILDGTACVIAGSVDVQYAPVARYAGSFAARGAVPGPLGRTYDVATAAYLTGAAAHILDFDDVQTTMGGHPSSTLLPVVLALGSALGVSGPEALRACRHRRRTRGAHRAIDEPLALHGWLASDQRDRQPRRIVGRPSLLLELDVETASRALGIAAIVFGRYKANFGTTTKSLHAGMAARAGIESALLAEPRCYGE